MVIGCYEVQRGEIKGWTRNGAIVIVLKVSAEGLTRVSEMGRGQENQLDTVELWWGHVHCRVWSCDDDHRDDRAREPWRGRKLGGEKESFSFWSRWVWNVHETPQRRRQWEVTCLDDQGCMEDLPLLSEEPVHSYTGPDLNALFSLLSQLIGLKK